MIQRVDGFSPHFESVRNRTLKYLRVVPIDSLDWSPRSGEFTCRDLICHIAAAERMFVGAAVGGRWKYVGHTDQPHDNLDQLLAYLDSVHEDAQASLPI